MTGTHFASREATWTAWMNRRCSLRPSKALELRSLRLGSRKRPSAVPWRCLLRESRLIQPSSSLSLSSSKVTRWSLTGEGLDAAASALRLRARRFSSVDGGWGESLSRRADGSLGEGREAPGEEVDETEAAAAEDRERGVGLGFGAGGRSTTTFSMRILGGSTLNFLPLLRKRGMAARTFRMQMRAGAVPRRLSVPYDCLAPLSREGNPSLPRAVCSVCVSK